MSTLFKLALGGAVLAATFSAVVNEPAPTPMEPAGLMLNGAPTSRNAPIPGERCSTLGTFADDGCSPEQAALPISWMRVATAKHVETSAGNNV